MNSTLTLERLPDQETTVTPQAHYWRILDDRILDKILRVLVPVSLVNIAIALYMALFYAPREATMGDAQRIFYFHVPSAWVGFLSFFIVFVASILFLRTRERKWDALALAAAEIGVLFTTLVLLTGPLWAKAAWGAYWVWDARLTTTLVLWLIYVGYLMLRSSVDDLRRARMAAVIGVIGFLDVPIIYLSVTWWRTMHPTLLINETGGLDSAMRVTLMVALLSFTLLFVWVLLLRVRLEQKRDALALQRARQEA
ncbi:MAG: cytochrome c biogenesis protein CcsA [Chloroflexi bacterium]|nr:cytochrome c biogenesis protein CcsA [Chloroflexota bacterium]